MTTATTAPPVPDAAPGLVLELDSTVKPLEPWFQPWVHSARSLLRFPSLAGPSCPWHADEGVTCTPMDCENFRTIPAFTPRHVDEGCL